MPDFQATATEALLADAVEGVRELRPCRAQAFLLKNGQAVVPDADGLMRQLAEQMSQCLGCLPKLTWVDRKAVFEDIDEALADPNAMVFLCDEAHRYAGLMRSLHEAYGDEASWETWGVDNPDACFLDDYRQAVNHALAQQEARAHA
jgi:hypothetical protein